MIHSTRRVLYFAIVFLAALISLALITNLIPAGDSASPSAGIFSAPPVMAAQPPPPNNPTVYTLTVTIVGSGTVMQKNQTTNATTTSTAPIQYISGTVVSLTEAPASGWTFTGWTGDFTASDNPHSVTMSQSRNVTATFAPSSPTCVTLNLSAGTGGSAVANPTSSGSCGNGKYLSSTVVTLTATANTNYVFGNWTGSVANASASQTTVTMDTDKTVAASFSACFALNVSANPSAGGTIAKNISPNCTGGTQYRPGATVGLTATANSGYTFSSWTGASGSTSSTTVTMDSIKNVVANFTLVQTASTPTATSTLSSSATQTAEAAANQTTAALPTALILGLYTPTYGFGTPSPTGTALPRTGLSADWMIFGFALVLVLFGARLIRKNSA